jgi:ribonuclease-3
VSGRRPLFSDLRRGRQWRLLALAAQLDGETVRQVFTHSSWVSERARSYERLEFLGDSVLSLAVTTELYRRFPGHSEGHLARLRAYVVSRATCAKVAKELGLDRLLHEVGADHDAAELEQLMTNQNVLADVTESLIGALYLTFGFDAVRPAVVESFAEHIDYAEKSYVDFKTELQEQLAKMGTGVTYRVVGFSGPPHDRNFAVEAVVDGETLGRGVGPSKKRAEQEAASQAMAELARREKRRRRRVRLLGPSRRGIAGEADTEEGDAVEPATGAPAAGAPAAGVVRGAGPSEESLGPREVTEEIAHEEAPPQESQKKARSRRRGGRRRSAASQGEETGGTQAGAAAEGAEDTGAAPAADAAAAGRGSAATSAARTGEEREETAAQEQPEVEEPPVGAAQERPADEGQPAPSRRRRGGRGRWRRRGDGTTAAS